MLCVQSNLKFARQPPVTPLLTVDFRGADFHKQLEHAALQRLFEHLQVDSYSSDGVVRQPLSSPYTKVSPRSCPNEHCVISVPFHVTNETGSSKQVVGSVT